jgi:hypothetical protein
LFKKIGWNADLRGRFESSSMVRRIVLATALTMLPVSSDAQSVVNTAQLHSLQQKLFNADKAVVFGSILDVFQDLGFSVASGDITSGLVVAESATVDKTSFWDAIGNVAGSGNIRATAFIETLPDKQTRVRLNFVSSKSASSAYGQNSRIDKPIADARLYQRFFSKIDEAMFIRTSGIPNPAGSTQIAPPRSANITPVAPVGQPVTVKIALQTSSLMAAAKRELEIEGFRVILFDLAAGAIATAPLPMHVTVDMADCGKSFGIAYLRDKRATTEVQYFLDIKEGVVTARLAIDGIYTVGYGHPDKTLQCASRGMIEAAFLGKIGPP